MDKKYSWVWVILVGVVLFLLFSKFNIVPTIQHKEEKKGVQMQVWVSDQYGNKVSKLSSGAMAIVEGTQTGFIVIDSNIENQNCAGLAQDDCVSPCIWDVDTGCFGGANILVTGANGISSCAPGNVNAGCSSISNNYGGATVGDTDGDGDIDGIYANAQPIPLNIGISNLQSSEAINVDELAFGQIRFQLNVLGSYLDEEGATQPLDSTFGFIDLNIIPEQCAVTGAMLGQCVDFTVLGDYRGNRCELVGGVPTEVQRSSECGCCIPGSPGSINCEYEPNGEACRLKMCGSGASVGQCSYEFSDNPTIMKCIYNPATNVAVEEPQCEACEGNGPDNIFGNNGPNKYVNNPVTGGDDECGVNGYNDYAYNCQNTNTNCISGDCKSCKFPARKPKTTVSIVKG